MNVLLLGSGGREHALALSISKSTLLNKLYSLPGNPGIAEIAQPFDCTLDNFYMLSDKCKVNEIDLVVVGPEQPLADGIADFLRNEGLNVFGPSKKAAMLESSKGFAKDFMQKYNIPTAAYRTFNDSQQEDALNYLRESSYPVVLKADGLAAGKGVIIAQSYEEAEKSVKSMFSGQFKDAGKTIVIEEFLKGEEASILAVTDGKDFITLASSQDHKRAFDGDLGPNTGGMGAYAPAPIVTDEVLEKVKTKILEPAISNLMLEGTPFIGCLYAGLMIKNGEPAVVEFNVRFGDPETQAVLPLIEGDFLGLIFSAARGKLDKSYINSVCTGHACSVVIASDGYPGKYETGHIVTGIKEAEKSGAVIFHAGTKTEDDVLKTAGGRVFAVTYVASSLADARNNAYNAVECINFKNKYNRNDIAYRAL